MFICVTELLGCGGVEGGNWMKVKAKLILCLGTAPLILRLGYTVWQWRWASDQISTPGYLISWNTCMCMLLIV
jgi:hypothetical protein